MKMTLKSTQVKELLEIDGFDSVLEDLGFNIDWRYYTTQGVSLVRVQTDVLVELAKMLRASKVRGTLTMSEDIESYLKLRSRDGKDKFNHKARKCEHFAENLIEALRNDPRHHLYKYESERNVWFASYVWDIEYHEEVTRDGWTEPEHVTINLGWNEFGQGKTDQVSFLAGDTVGLTILETLQRKALFIEDETRRTDYLESIKRFQELRDQIGLQCLAEGIGDDINAEDRSWWRNTIIRLDRDGRSNVVIDVFTEDDDEENNRHGRRSHSINDRWWTRFDDEDTDDDDSDESEIPTHPMIAVFDLKRHIRLRVHINQLEEYEYDQSLSDKLVLPAEHRELIDALLTYTGTFSDIIAGKGGGATILCSGRPGTGKTLTAEVYAEVMKRPLYTVQCSQLGTDPDQLEKNIQTIFARSYRWNAVLLLDEADVYVAERGNSLEQNAIVRR